MDGSIPQDHIAFGPETPFAADTFSRATCPDEPEPCLPETKPSGLRRTLSTSVKPSITRSSTQQSQRSHCRETSVPEHIRPHHGHTTGSRSAQTSPRPYETPVFAPQYSHIDTKEPYFGKPPMSPQDSVTGSSTPDKSPTQPSINAFPGTMATRNARTRTSARQRAAGKDRRKKAAQSHQWKSVFKGIFTRSPVDKAQFERIKGRHWSDE